MIKKPSQHIKSFVLRQGHLNEAQKKALSEYWPTYGLTPPNTLLDFKQVFSSEGPVILEIGFGNGDTLIHLAQQHPDKNFIGIEVHKPGVGSLLLKLEKYQLTNVRVFCFDAIEVLEQSIPNESLEAVFLLFPDPWPKRRHNKRRIVQPTFVELIQKKIAPGGRFHLATDWEDYAQQMSDVVSQNPAFTLNTSLSSDQNRPTTKFETRGKRLGYSVWDFIFEKSSHQKP